MSDLFVPRADRGAESVQGGSFLFLEGGSLVDHNKTSKGVLFNI